MSRYIYATILAVLLACRVGNSEDNIESDESMAAVQAYNYCVVSLNNIITYNDKFILDQEINTIINNLNIRRIPDITLMMLFSDLQKQATKCKISEGEREILQEEHEAKMRKAMVDSLPSASSILSCGPNPIAIALNAIQAVGSSYIGYRDKMDDYRRELKKDTWNLDKAQLLEISEIRGEFLKAAYGVGAEFKFPDKWRLSEKQVVAYLNAVKEKDLQKRFRKLDSIKHEYDAYPPFWYFYGKTCQEMGNVESALDAFEKFDKANRGILRKDPYIAAVCMSRLTLLQQQSPRGKTRYKADDVERMMANAEDKDANYYIFGAIILMSLDKYEEAQKLIQHNLDYLQAEGMSRFLMADIMMRKKDIASLDSLVRQVALDQNSSMTEVLYLVGKAKVKALLVKVVPQIESIKVEPKPSLWGNMDLKVQLPDKWDIDGCTNVCVVQTGGRHVPNPKNIVYDKKRRLINLKYEDIIDGKSYEGKTLRMLELEVGGTQYPVHLWYVPIMKQNITGKPKLDYFCLTRVSMLGEQFKCTKTGKVIVDE